ncbi:MAG: NAD(P)H-hydrate dehydratase [Chitinophagaceae bacterium]|nr:NAD(P)H-hydrate dehydratase [Chitinophagaceae bacterium]
MKILSANEIRLWDQFTIEQEPISSIDLMERAAGKCVEWLLQHYPEAHSFGIFCGKGNNGGDGLAIARMLMEQNYEITVYILDPIAIGFGHKGTDDFQTNLARLHKFPQPDIHFIQSEQHFPSFREGQIIIDALFGSGLNRKLEGVTANLVEHINKSRCEIIALDIPSGLFVDHSSKGAITILANHTLSFQSYKPAFLFAENEEAVGEIHILDIGLHPDFCQSMHPAFELVDDVMIHSIYKPRKKFAHKGNFGHALLVTGSKGKMGAAVLAAKACMRSGVGLLTCHIPGCGYDILQSTVPEAMVISDVNTSFNTKSTEDLIKFKAIGIGPGIGIATETKMLLQEILDAYRNPVVLDADALNLLSAQKDLFKLIPAGSILTPHPKEFERLFGETNNEFDRVLLALQKAKELNCIIVLKGHHTFIATSDGRGFFNSTGNPGMATAGSGDVLTGILTGLLAQGYSTVETALLGVYLHGVAGDFAAKEHSLESMVAGDIIDSLGKAFSFLNT